MEKVKDVGLEAYLGKEVLLMCMSYFYYGKLVAVGEEAVTIEDPHIVYETGKWSDSNFQNKQSLCVKEHHVMRSAIESFGEYENK